MRFSASFGDDGMIGAFVLCSDQHWPSLLLEHEFISSVQSLSRVRLSWTPWTAARQCTMSS